MDKIIELKLTKCELYLTEAEITSLLAHDTELWKLALKRGKWEKRCRATEARYPEAKYNSSERMKAVRHGEINSSCQPSI
jgi:hypothetical protein